MTTALEDLLRRHVEVGTIPGAVAMIGPGDGDADDAEVVAVGTAAVGGGRMRDDAIMRIQSMTKAVTSVAALRLVEAGRLGLDQGVDDLLPELANPRVLSSPTAELDDTRPARRTITLRHLLTNASGYGMAVVDSPLQRAMADNGTEAGPEPSVLSADEWLLRLAEDLFEPLGMTDTGSWVPTEKLDRLPAAYRHGNDGLVETEPAGGGPYAGPAPVDVSHGELVSTARDYFRFARMLSADGRRAPGQPLISSAHLHQMTSDQVPASSKTPDSFFPGFWEGMGWGYGVGVQTGGAHSGRFGWSGGQGTDFFVDPDGTVAILLTQVELTEPLWPLLEDFQSIRTTPH